MEAYKQRELKYPLNGLEPHISEEQLSVHYNKHHTGYIKNANALMEKLDAARKSGEDLDMKSVTKSLTFNMGGHILHSLFWENMVPEKDAKGKPEGKTAALIDKNFGSFDRFKDEFSKIALSIEGSGWAALAYDWQSEKLILLQIEKHNVNIVPSLYILLVLDMWEHAFYIDYKNVKEDFVENFWKIVNWDEVETRLEGM
jgi:Fe-Mn family superoxide dismutase